MYSPWTVNSPAFLYRDSFNSPGKHKDNLFIGHRHEEAYTKCVLRDSLAFSTSRVQRKRVNSIPAAAFNWYLWAPKTIPFCWETRFDFSLPNTQCVYMGCWINWTRNLWGESKCDAYCVAGRKWSALRGHLDVCTWVEISPGNWKRVVGPTIQWTYCMRLENYSFLESTDWFLVHNWVCS
jgi:hypothetical protein